MDNMIGRMSRCEDLCFHSLYKHTTVKKFKKYATIIYFIIALLSFVMTNVDKYYGLLKAILTVGPQY